MNGFDTGFVFRQARRELRAGFSGFRVFLICLFLGVSAIASVGTVTSSFVAGLATESRALLGGDLDVRLTHRPATKEERAWLQEWGSLSEVISFQTMGFAPKSDDRRLIELKGVDQNYPLYGSVKHDGASSFQDRLVQREGRYGALVEETLLSRLGLDVGDSLRIGASEFAIRGIIKDEPDRVAGGFRYGPRVMVSTEALGETGLVQVGSLIRYRYRLALPETAQDDETLQLFRDGAEEAYGGAGWRIQDRRNSAPGVRFFINRVSMFLSLVGLAALIVGGVGVGNAVKSYLDRKQEVIATFKCLGADGASIFAIYLVQVLAMALVAIALGLIAGAMVPLVLAAVLGGILPIPVKPGFYPSAMAQASLFGVLVTIAFALWPLARARDLSPANLFRDLVGKERGWPRWPYLAGIAVAVLVMVGSAIFFSPYAPFAAFFLAGVAVSFLLLAGAAYCFLFVVKKAPRARRASWRMALANLHRPGAPTTSVVLSMGLGLTLVVTVALIDGNLSRQITSQIPEDAPAFFFIDIQKAEIEAFDGLMAELEGVSDFNRVPNLRGPILRLNEVPVTEAEVDPEARWALNGDRGLTYATVIPEGSQLAEGSWWHSDYLGPPLISIEEELARGFGLSVGDTLTFSVLGREITATLANTRVFDWQAPDFNYAFVFAPGTLEAAPHTFVGNVRVDPAQEEELYRRVGDEYPGVTIVRVKEALSAINDILSDLTLGVRITSLVTVVAGILVLAGALAAGHRRRIYDAVVLKVLGATKGWVIKVYIFEFAALGLMTASIAAILGTFSAYLVVTQAMGSQWIFLPGRLFLTIAVATVVTVGLGLLGTWRVLGAKAAPVLRSA